MKKSILVVTTIFIVANANFLSAQTAREFRKLLKENHLEFGIPEDFVYTVVKENGDLYYNYAIKYEHDTLEVRYTIFPLKPYFKEYEESLNDPNTTVLDPNSYFESMFIANILNVSQSGMENIPQTTSFPKEAVMNEFGADEGVTSFFEANSEFAEGYSHCLMIGLHKKGIADVYISFLGNTQHVFEEHMLKAFHSIRFKD